MTQEWCRRLESYVMKRRIVQTILVIIGILVILPKWATCVLIVMADSLMGTVVIRPLPEDGLHYRVREAIHQVPVPDSQFWESFYGTHRPNIIGTKHSKLAIVPFWLSRCPPRKRVHGVVSSSLPDPSVSVPTLIEPS